MKGLPEHAPPPFVFYRGIIVLVRIAVIFLVSVVFALGTEALVAVQSKGGISALMEIAPNAWSLTVSSIAAAICLIWAATNQLLLTVLAAASLLLFLAQAHVRKFAVLGRPLVPWDILEGRQVLALFHTVSAGHLGVIVLLAGILLTLCMGLVFLARRKARWPMRWPIRLVVAILGGSLLFVLGGSHSPQLKFQLREKGVINRLWDNNENVRCNGLLLSLLLNLRSLSVYQPVYSEAAVTAALSSFEHPSGNAAGRPGRPEKSPIGPDVILYLGEAAWDPSALGIKFNVDPIPTLRRLWESSGRRTLLSPVFGGGTANAEFEILTGIPMAMLPEDSFPYQHYISRRLESIPSIFRKHGYRTVAVHPFHSWFWGRNVVYPLLGFETFVTSDQMGPPLLDGPYPSDDPLVDRLFQELDRSDADPVFAMAISIVTHGPYLYARRPDTEVKVLDSLDPNTVQELENYATSLLHADRSLGRLIEKLEKRTRPTVLIFFGDHLPALGPNKSIYRQTGFLPEYPGTPEAQAKMARVPVAVWANFPVERTSGELGMNFLGPYILRTAGIEPSGYFAFLDDLQRRVQVVQHNIMRANESWYFGSGDPRVSPEIRRDIDRLFLLGYDRLLGSGYSQLCYDKPDSSGK